MNIGMLWFDNDPKAELNTKIERAAAYYRNKYGRTPTLCFVHPSMLPVVEGEAKPEPKPVKSGELEVRPTRSVLPNHFWIGVNGSYPSGAD
ncbi:MAG TPA: hypothetical protein VF498_19345 [Anaerolineales bacterium]